MKKKKKTRKRKDNCHFNDDTENCEEFTSIIS